MSRNMTFFELIHKDKNTKARAGVVHTDHGDVETPVFMPVGTQGAVKTLDSNDLESLGAQIILGNNYHLHLRPGEDLINDLGGLHKFMNWPHPILTDSGGFQVFSLGLQKEKSTDRGGSNAKLVEIDEEGVTFHSHVDGSKHRFTPKKAIETQHKIGADIIMAFDECTPDSIPEEYTRAAMERTHRWAERCLVEHKKIKADKTGLIKSPHQRFLFGIIQGSNNRSLREESARFIASKDFDGIALGGESVGYNMQATKDILDWVYPFLPEDKPHYAMGLGLSPLDFFDVVERGVDMFDCVAPTRLARHGVAYISKPTKDNDNNYRLNLNNAAQEKNSAPIEENCACPTCQNYSRAYLHHLLGANEISGLRLITLHNVYFMLNLVRQMRQSIVEDRFQEFKKEWGK